MTFKGLVTETYASVGSFCKSPTDWYCNGHGGCSECYAGQTECFDGGRIGACDDSGQWQPYSTCPPSTPVCTGVDDIQCGGVRGVAAGVDHTCAVIQDGTVRCWGANSFNELGLGSPSSSKDLPTIVPDLKNIKQVTAGDGHSCALDYNGDVWCWGKNLSGESGIANGGSNVSKPTKLSVSEVKFESIASHASHSCGVTTSGTVYCWGSNTKLQAGVNGGSVVWTPTKVNFPDSATVQTVSVGKTHTCASNAANVFCWGDNANGQVGVPGITTTAAPKYVDVVVDPKTPSSIFPVFVGEDTSFVASCKLAFPSPKCTAETVLDYWGILGVCSGKTKNTKPVLTTSTTITTSVKFYRRGEVQATLDKGTILIVGSNQDGLLGNGKKSTTCTAESYSHNLADIAGITLGARHMCAWQDDGLVWCWGNNTKDQLAQGAGGPTEILSPVPIKWLNRRTPCAPFF